MTAAIVWGVVWLLGGLAGTWLLGVFMLFAFAFGGSSAVDGDKTLATTGFVASILIALANLGWTGFWIIQVILQIVSIINHATGVSA